MLEPVDLVLAADGPVLAFEGRIGVDVADVVSVDAADWTVEDNIGCPADTEKCGLASWYAFGLMEWYTIHEDGSASLGTDAAQLDDPTVSAVWSDALDLSALTGPINAPAGELYTTTAKLGGLTPGLTEAAQTVVVTLRLDIAPHAGTIRITLTDGYAADATGALILLEPGADLELIVGGE